MLASGKWLLSLIFYVKKTENTVILVNNWHVKNVSKIKQAEVIKVQGTQCASPCQLRCDSRGCGLWLYNFLANDFLSMLELSAGAPDLQWPHHNKTM